MPKLPATQSYKGVFPVAPTVFDAQGRLDLEGQKRAVDFMIDAGSHGLCILANFSEQFLLTDEERERVMVAVLEHVAGRVPVIVTTTHFSSFVCAERSRRAQDLGAAMVMVMPPYHGATFRVPEASIFEFYRHVSDAISIPIMVQDAPVAGTPLPVPFLARMARKIENLAYFKIEVPQAAAYQRWLPLINYENRQCGLAACKALMREGGVIAHETLRAPLPAMHPATRAGLIEIARRLDPIVLRWGR